MQHSCSFPAKKGKVKSSAGITQDSALISIPSLQKTSATGKIQLLPSKGHIIPGSNERVSSSALGSCNDPYAWPLLLPPWQRLLSTVIKVCCLIFLLWGGCQEWSWAVSCKRIKGVLSTGFRLGCEILILGKKDKLFSKSESNRPLGLFLLFL